MKTCSSDFQEIKKSNTIHSNFSVQNLQKITSIENLSQQVHDKIKN
jgi:hypothetical protein